MLQKCCIFLGHLPEHQGCFFRYSRHPWDMYYIWHMYFGDLGHSALQFICAHSADAQEVPHFFRTFTWASELFFLDIPDTAGTCITFGIYISDILDIQPPIYLCKSCWCSRGSAFFQDIYLSIRAVFFRLFEHFWDMYCIYFRHFGHLAPNLFVHILLMLRKFCIFPGHLPEHQGCFFSDIPDIPRTCIPFVHVNGIFTLDISDIQPSNLSVHIKLILQKLRIFSGCLPEHQSCFILDIPHIPGTCITFVHVGSIFISDISEIQPPIYLCTSS